MKLEHTSDYYTGEYLLEKLGILPCDLINGIRRQIVPYPINEIDGTFRTPESDPALYDPALDTSPEAWLDKVKTAKFFKPFIQTFMPKIQAELLTAWEAGDDEIIDSAEKLKLVVDKVFDIEICQGDAEKAYDQMRAFEKFAAMSGKEFATVAKAKWAVDLLSSTVRFHDRATTRREDYVSGLRTPDGGKEAATTPGHVQEGEDQEPTNAASYVVWRRQRVRSIHAGQLMLEVQERWGRPPKKTMDRPEIAALVRGEDPPSPNDTNRRRCLEDAFKNAVKAYRATLKK